VQRKKFTEIVTYFTVAKTTTEDFSEVAAKKITMPEFLFGTIPVHQFPRKQPAHYTQRSTIHTHSAAHLRVFCIC
jgi:hypothetical protein